MLSSSLSASSSSEKRELSPEYIVEALTTPAGKMALLFNLTHSPENIVCFFSDPAFRKQLFSLPIHQQSVFAKRFACYVNEHGLAVSAYCKDSDFQKLMNAVKYQPKPKVTPIPEHRTLTWYQRLRRWCHESPTQEITHTSQRNAPPI